MAGSLPKHRPGCKAWFFVAGLLLAGPAAAQPPAAGPSLRECVARAADATAMAACERREQVALKARVAELSAAIRARLDNRGRQLFERNVTAWQAFVDSEDAMLALSLGQRADGLGPTLRPGAVTRLYEERVRQLREHLHSLNGPRLPPAAGS